MSKRRDNRGSYPKYQVSILKGKHVVRKFTGFDHMWAEYSKPLVEFSTKQEAETWVKTKLYNELMDMPGVDDRRDDSARDEDIK